MTVFRTGLAAMFATVLLAPPLFAQQQTAIGDPIAIEQRLLRWQMDDLAQRRAESHKERIQREQERVHDRKMCLKAGYRGPDVDQCVRASAEYRRGEPDFSTWGTPAESDRRERLDCVTLGDGLGGGITDCN